MDANTARTAAFLVGKLDLINGLLTGIGNALSSNCLITGLRLHVVDPNGNGDDINLGDLDAPSSVAALQLAQSIYETQANTLTTTLSAM